MKCKWCNGTGDECGCGLGHCAHCYKGEVTNPPYNVDKSTQLSDKDVNFLANYYTEMPRANDVFETSFRDFLQQIAARCTVKHKFISDEDMQLFFNYWCDDYRDCTLGDYIRYVAKYVEDTDTKAA